MLKFTVAVMCAVSFTAVLTAQQPRSFYDLKTTSLDGTPADLGQYRGKVSLVVNVASQCGYTPQYAGLEKLHRELKGKGFNVLGFPSNDFGGQEPGTAQEIATFCRTNYDVTFPMFEKLVTRRGAGQSPIMRCQSDMQTPAALTLTRASPSLGPSCPRSGTCRGLWPP